MSAPTPTTSKKFWQMLQNKFHRSGLLVHGVNNGHALCHQRAGIGWRYPAAAPLEDSLAMACLAFNGFGGQDPAEWLSGPSGVLAASPIFWRRASALAAPPPEWLWLHLRHSEPVRFYRLPPPAPVPCLAPSATLIAGLAITFGFQNLRAFYPLGFHLRFHCIHHRTRRGNVFNFIAHHLNTPGLCRFVNGLQQC